MAEATLLSPGQDMEALDGLDHQDADKAWKPKTNPWVIALTVTLATFMEVLDSSIANVALPHIGGALGATQNEATWVLTSYLVANAIVLPAAAYLTTSYRQLRLAGWAGRRRLRRQRSFWPQARPASLQASILPWMAD